MHSPSSGENAPLLTPSILPNVHTDGAQVSHAELSSEGGPVPVPSIRLKIFATMVSFVTLGMYTSSIGVMLPALSTHYDLGDLNVSFIFLVVPLGYVLAASLNSPIHSRYGQRGIAFSGPLLHVASAILVGLHPDFSVLLFAFALMSMGTGLLDGSWCAYAAAMENAGFISGLLHGSFSVGASLGPLCAGMLMEKGVNWWKWYYILAIASFLAFLILVYAFRGADATHYQSAQSHFALSGGDSFRKAFFRMLNHRATYYSSFYFLTYVGIETAISGWVVSFTLRYLHGTPYLASLSSSGFWAGMAIGRLLLGHSTDRIGIRRAATIYLLLAISVQAAFAFVRAPVGAVLLMTILGAVMGPLFPSGVVVLTQLLPLDLHVISVSFVGSLGQVGGAVLPFGIGALIETAGPGAFRWVILLFTGFSLAIWIAFAMLRSTKAVDDAPTPREAMSRGS